MKGALVQPLALNEWKRRKNQLHARDKTGVLERWFEQPRAMLNRSTDHAKK
jgi:hypothetical protein